MVALSPISLRRLLMSILLASVIASSLAVELDRAHHRHAHRVLADETMFEVDVPQAELEKTFSAKKDAEVRLRASPTASSVLTRPFRVGVALQAENDALDEDVCLDRCKET